MRILLFIGLLAGFCPFAWAECQIFQEPAWEGKRIILQNGEIRVEVLTFGGRISSFRWRETEYLESVKEKWVSRSPLLPRQLVSNYGGYSDWYWGLLTPSPRPFEVKRAEAGEEQAVVRLEANGFPWKISRTVTIRKGSKALHQSIELSHGHPGAPETVSYWAHLLPNSRHFVSKEGKSLILLPGKKGGNPFHRRTTSVLPAEGVQTVATTNADNFYEVFAPRVALVSPDRGDVLVLRTTSDRLGETGLFCHWQNRTLATLEFIHHPVAVKERVTYEIVIEPFASAADFEKTL